MATLTGEKIYGIIQDVITPKSEETCIKSLVSELYNRGVAPEVTEEIIKTLYSEIIKNNPNLDRDWEWADYQIYLDEIYLEDVSPNNGLDGLNIYLTGLMKKHEALHIINELKNILRKYETNEVYELRISTDKYIVMNKAKKIIQAKNVKTTTKGDNTKFETVINAYPNEIVIHDSPITDMGRTFTLKWISRTSGRVFETKQSSISEIENYLQEAGWVINPKHLRGSLAAMIDISITNKLATIKTDIDNPGFYYDCKNKELLKVNYELSDYRTDLKKSIKVLENLNKYSDINKSKLATCIKWGLVAPFSYARKQCGASWIPWLYLYGKARSGKTTVGLIILYLWSMPDNSNNIGGSGFDTPARVGEKLGISTFPLLVNEPEGALQKPSVMGLIKSAIESTTARGKFDRGKYRNLPAFAPVMITANMYLPQEDAILRRFEVCSFSHSEKQDPQKAKEFEERFGLNNPSHSPLLDLHYLSSFVFDYVHLNPKMLRMDWKELADELLHQAYAKCGQEVPSWLKLWNESATLEELDEEEIEDIRMFFVDEINNHSKQIKVYDSDSGYAKNETYYSLDDGIADNDDFKERVWNVLNQRLIPWCGLRRARSGDIQVYFTAGIKRDIGKYTKTCKDLKSISELLGWDYKTVALSKRAKVMIVEFDTFIEFLSPNLEEDFEVT